MVVHSGYGSTKVEYKGLIHTCNDDDCHVVNFVKTLNTYDANIGDKSNGNG